MSRPRIYANSAERQQAYRERKASERLPTQPPKLPDVLMLPPVYAAFAPTGLTSELKLKNSRASLFMNTLFPNRRRFIALCRERISQDFVTHRPDGQIPWGLMGTALDYRIRFYFPQSNPIENLVCYLGAANASGGEILHIAEKPVLIVPPEKELPGYIDSGLLDEFIDDLKTVLYHLNPVGRRLGDHDEELLLRYCVVMAALEVFRRKEFDPFSILLNPTRKETLPELLSVAENNWIDDLRTLSWGFYDNYQSLLAQPSNLNPTFDGSMFIGGADADLIIGGCLIDIKTNINPLRDWTWIYQLLGYALLDWHDDNRIREVAIYFSRQSYLLKWNLNEFMEVLSGRPTDLAETRRQWYDFITPPFFANVASEEKLDEASSYTKVNGMWKHLSSS